MTPEEEYMESLYPLNGKAGGYGFPCTGFKNAIVSACRNVDGIPMTLVRNALFILSDGAGLVKIKGKPIMRTDMVRVGRGAASPRYRAEFSDWSVILRIQYNAGVLSAANLINLINIAGFGVGIGDWRPERNGEFGRWAVVADKTKGQ